MSDEDIEEIADRFAGKFDSISCSSRYAEKNTVVQRELKLSQAMCLLWQNSTTGEVLGRYNDLHLLVGVYCAAVLDLLNLDKISCNDVMSTCLCLVSKKKMVEIPHNDPTSTYLDELTLKEMIEHRHHPRELVDWLEDSVDKNDDVNAAMCTLGSLVKGGILRREKLSVGTRYHLNNQEVKQRLVQEVRDALLTDNTCPDLFMRIVLTLLQAADHYRDNYEKDKIFKQYFSKQEYKEVKARLKTISRDWPAAPCDAPNNVEHL